MTSSDPSQPTPAPQAHTLPADRKAMRAEIDKRFAAELHMLLILGVCFGVGLIVTKVLLMTGIGAMWLRYSVALIAAYAAFLGCIRFWLAYAGYAPLPNIGALKSAADTTGGRIRTWRLPNFGRSAAGASAKPTVGGGGGNFGGGGASASFANAAGSADAAGAAAPLFSGISSPPYTNIAGVGGDGVIGGNAGDDGGWDADVDADVDGGDGDSGGWDRGGGDGGAPAVVAIALVAGFLAIFGAVIYLVSMAPTILGDAAFAALLTGGLVGSTRRIRADGWVGSAIRATWRPFALVFALNLAFALAAWYFYPDARTLADVLARL